MEQPEKTVKVTIIGDLFMRADAFERALNEIPDVTFQVTRSETSWPDTPFGAPFDGVKEYQGTAAETARLIADSEICITHLAPLPRSVFEACPNLKLIAVSRGGPVNIDIEAARDHGVQVVNAPGRNATAVAEFTVGMILAQTRLITAGHADLSRGIWRGDLYRQDRTGFEMSELAVGLVGYSNVGRRVANLLKPFGCRILFSDPFVDLTEEDRAAGIEKRDFDALLKEADVVSLHARVTPQTENMFSADVIAAMKPGAYLINTARGELIDQPALVRALQSGHLRGAALDTYVPEPPDPKDPMLTLPNITLTPHIAGASVHVITYAANVIKADVQNYLAAKPLNNPC